MKKIFPLFLAVTLLLSACSVLNPSPVQPTPSDEQLATRVAQILTSMPSPTTEVQQPQPTLETPSAVPPTETAVPPTETALPSPNTPTAIPATATALPALPAVTGTINPDDQVGGGGPGSTVATGVPSIINAPATPTPPATSTLPSTDQRARLGNPAFSDPMDNGNNWPSGIDPAGFTSVAYNNGQMQLTGLKTRNGWRLSTWGTDLRDFYIETRFSTLDCKGNDRFGLYFRVPNKVINNQGYWFGLTCDGRYALQMWDGAASTDGIVTNLIYWKTNSAINVGSNKTNRLGVMAIGRHMWLYINGVLVAQKENSTWLQGAFGVFVGARETPNMTILVDQVDVWTNPIAP